MMNLLKYIEDEFVQNSISQVRHKQVSKVGEQVNIANVQHLKPFDVIECCYRWQQIDYQIIKLI